MRHLKAHCTQLLLCVMAAVVAVLCHLCLHRWDLHSRLELLLHGHICYRLAPIKKTYTHLPNEFVSKVVLQRGECIGYLTRDGYFLAPDSSSLSLGPHALALTTSLLYTQFLFLIISGSIGLSLFVVFIRRKMNARANQ